ncbi:hypothetical protein [Halopolyspora algeriensis]|uniref:hypothetical protein n=1 Tax=Halopolyspora algeriensis TaxID=1500506 RepID=UPI001FE9BA86|nr:hypothetical protein [Halopolyspora algeriensis]
MVGLVLLGAGMWARRRDPGLARMAQILGVVITALGLLILAGLTTTTSSGSDGPSSPPQVPRHR